MRETDLAERVHAVLTEEYEGHRCLAIERCHSVLEDGCSTEREMDLLDWGMVYGLAHGILLARAPELSDPVELSRQAHVAARMTYTRWGGSITGRLSAADVGELVDSVIMAFEESELEMESASHGLVEPILQKSESVKTLTTRIRALRDAVGVPELVR